MFAGPSADGHQFLLVTKRIYGRQLTEQDGHLLPAALSALRFVHAAGVCHGDIRLPNFIVETHDPASVRLLDSSVDRLQLCCFNMLHALILLMTQPSNSYLSNWQGIAYEGPLLERVIILDFGHSWKCEKGEEWHQQVEEHRLLDLLRG